MLPHLSFASRVQFHFNSRRLRSRTQLLRHNDEIDQGKRTEPAKVQVQSCENAYLTCMKAGRNPFICANALMQCDHGLPTIFAPGIVGRDPN